MLLAKGHNILMLVISDSRKIHLNVLGAKELHVPCCFCYHAESVHWNRLSNQHLGVVTYGSSRIFLGALHVYKDGNRRTETATAHHNLNFVSVRTDFEIVFGRVDTTQDGKHCDCLIDDVQIFEMELNAEEIMELFTYN